MLFARSLFRDSGRYDGIQFPSIIIYCLSFICRVISSEVGILSGIGFVIVILSANACIYDAWQYAWEDRGRRCDA